MKDKLKIIQGEKQDITDEEFQMFVEALMGPYIGPPFRQE